MDVQLALASLASSSSCVLLVSWWSMEWNVNCISSTSRIRHTALRSISRDHQPVRREDEPLSDCWLALLLLPLPEEVDEAYEPCPACCCALPLRDSRLVSRLLSLAIERLLYPTRLISKSRSSTSIVTASFLYSHTSHEQPSNIRE